MYLTTGAPPSAKFDGELKSLSDERLSPGFTQDLAYELMDGQQAREFDELEMKLAISLYGIGRFSQYLQTAKRSWNGGSLYRCRYFANAIAGLPSIAADLIKRKRGLLLVVGAMGQVSHRLAFLIDHRNSTMGGHIVTIEDPVEFIHRQKQSIVNQRELGVDTRSWEST